MNDVDNYAALRSWVSSVHVGIGDTWNLCACFADGEGRTAGQMHGALVRGMFRAGFAWDARRDAWLTPAR